MREFEMARGRWFRLSAGAVAAVAVALVFAASSLAHTIGGPRVRWSASKIEQGIGEVQIAKGTHRKSQLDEVFDLGPSAFSVGPLAGRGSDWVHSTNPIGTPITSATYRLEADAPSLAHRVPFAQKGGIAHLDWSQAYDRRRHDADLQFKIDDLELNNIDDNGPLLSPVECPVAAPCDSIRAIVRYHLRAWTVAGGHVFFNVGGGLFGEGYEHAWLVGAATALDSGSPFWADATFDVHRDFEGDGTGSHLIVRLREPIVLSVPLKKVPRGALFGVHLTMDAEAINDRGFESAASARIDDPPLPGPGLVARGLTARAAPSLKEPPLTQRPPARCRGGAPRRAGTLQFSNSAYTVGEASGTPLVLVERLGGSRGATSAIVDTRGGSARSASDFKRTRTVVRFENGDTSPRLVEIPVREDLAAESPESFQVSLAHPRCGRLGKRHSASVTILDDDTPASPPPPTFTIGGSVDGLAGSGLVLSNLGAELPVAGNGSFTFPGTASTGQTYEVNVKTQPHNPDQVCGVQNGAGHVGVANVTDVAVRCQTPAAPSGLDLTFGDGGRVCTPVGGNGQGEAVVIQPSGQIVTAGWRTVGTGINTDFALTRHNDDGTLDSSFGTGGIATTDLGGADDQAFDAALLPDNGIVAVGRTDALGILKTAFGVVRYLPDGTLNPDFGTGGIVTTDIFGKGAVARAVAVQPDGKIVVAGFAISATGIDADFALVRYNPDGSLDTSFGTGGIVTTDLGTQNDDADALAIQPDGRIVVAGSAGEDIGLARYTPSGQLDPTFGAGGVLTVSKLGDANGVALTPSGAILLAGSSGGDFMLVRLASSGALDKGFGNLGVVKTDIGGGDDFGENLTVDGAGRIIVVGRATSATIFDMALVRYNPDGTLDTSFDGDGILTADFHGSGEFGQDVALDTAGRIVAAGYTADGSDIEFALMRANP